MNSLLINKANELSSILLVEEIVCD